MKAGLYSCLAKHSDHSSWNTFKQRVYGDNSGGHEERINQIFLDAFDQVGCFAVTTRMLPLHLHCLPALLLDFAFFGTHPMLIVQVRDKMRESQLVHLSGRQTSVTFSQYFQRLTRLGLSTRQLQKFADRPGVICCTHIYC